MNYSKKSLVYGLLLIGLGWSGQLVAALGVEWNWAKQTGEFDYSQGLGVAVDTQKMVYVTGIFWSPTVAFDNITLTNSGGTNLTADLFISKYDPFGNVLWARQAGGIFPDNGRALAVDNQGAVYVTGSFISPTVAFGSVVLTNTTLSTNDDIFIAKYTADGQLLWARSAGGTSFDYGSSITTDPAGNVFITGEFWSPTITFGATALVNQGRKNMFIAKYDAQGNALWAKSAGGTNLASGTCLAANPDGSVYVSGYFSSPTATFGTAQITNRGDFDIFLAKYDAAGNLLWAESAGGTGNDGVNGMAADAQGNAYVTGDFASSQLTLGNIVLTNATAGSPTNDIFIAKYDPNGNPLWAKQAGGLDKDIGRNIAVDAAGNAYLTGYFLSRTATFDSLVLTNGFDTNLFVSSDIFVVKYDTAGNAVWAKKAGGWGFDFPESVAVDSDANVYLTGEFTYFSCSFGLNRLYYTGDFSAYIAKLGSEVLTVVQPPQDRVVEPGSNATFSVGVAGPGPLYYQWQKDAAAIAGATNASLVLTNVSTAQTGSYSVVVTNATSSITSPSALLTVQATVPVLVLSIALSNHAPVVSIQGNVGRTYGLEYATNLVPAASWTTLTNVTLSTSIHTWMEPESTNQSQRFYRAVLRP